MHAFQSTNVCRRCTNGLVRVGLRLFFNRVAFITLSRSRSFTLSVSLFFLSLSLPLSRCQTTCTHHLVTVRTCLQLLSWFQQNRLPFDMIVERRPALSRVEPADGSPDSAAAATSATQAWSPQQTWSICNNSVRQEVADEMQQVRNELNETANGRLDMLNGIATALQRVTANAAPRPHRISDLIPRHRGRQQRQGRVQTFHDPALVDASMV